MLSNDGRRTRILAVIQGTTGGIGRVELLLDRAWKWLAPTRALDVHTVRKRNWPAYTPWSWASQAGKPVGSRWALARTILRRCLLDRPDIVLFGHLNFSPVGLVIRALRPATKLVTVAHGIEAWGRLPALMSLALRRGNMVWSVSAYTQGMLAKHSRIPAAKIRVLPLGLMPEQLNDLKGGSPCRSSALKTHGTSILTVARLVASEKYKGIDHVLQALPFITQKVPTVSYVVVGTGTDLPRLYAIADELAIRSRVCFLGAISDKELIQAYRDCDVFALPSGREGFGLVFLEAMAARKPVVAAKAGGVPEIVLDGRTGVLVDYGDVHALADSLSTLLSDDGLRQRMGEAGQQRVEETFTFDHFAQRVGDLLDELM